MRAFSYCDAITCLRVPDSAIHIGKNAFENISLVTYNGTAAGAPWGAKEIQSTKADGTEEESR